jgi:hypothetical protein
MIEVEDRYRQQYWETINALPRDGVRAGKREFRTGV